jgi:hypothetical protein
MLEFVNARVGRAGICVRPLALYGWYHPDLCLVCAGLFWFVLAYFGMCWLHVPALLSSRLSARSTDLWLSMRCMVHGGEDGA